MRRGNPEQTAYSVNKATDTSEKGLEALIVAQMTRSAAAVTGPGFAEELEPIVGLHNWILGNPQDYDRAYTVDLAQLRAFLAATQEDLVQAFDLDNDSPTRDGSYSDYR